jgi:hypothetical protein
MGVFIFLTENCVIFSIFAKRIVCNEKVGHYSIGGVGIPCWNTDSGTYVVP